MEFKEAIKERYSCRNYNAKTLDKKVLDEILEAGRLSPSSLGLETWKFVVIRDTKRKAEISKIANNQAQVAQCAAIIAVLARLDFVEYFEPKLRKRKMSEAEIQARLSYRSFLEKMNPQEKIAYAREQCFLALGNLANCAASLGVRSCIIGGMDNAKLDEYLKLDISKFRSVVLLTLGYSDEAIPPKVRFDFDEIVEYQD